MFPIFISRWTIDLAREWMKDVAGILGQDAGAAAHGRGQAGGRPLRHGGPEQSGVRRGQGGGRAGRRPTRRGRVQRSERGPAAVRSKKGERAPVPPLLAAVQWLPLPLPGPGACLGLVARAPARCPPRVSPPAPAPQRPAPSARCPPLPPSSPISPPRIFARDSRPLSGPSSPLPSSMFADANPNLVYCLRCLCVCVRACACVCTLAAPSAAPGRASPRPPSPPRAALAQMATACLSSVAASLPPSPNCHRYVSMRPPPCPLRSCSSSLPPPSFLPQQPSLSLNMAPITLAYASCRARLPAASNWTMSPAASRESLMAISATAFPL